MARLRKINGSYYAYFYDRGRTPKEKSWPLRCSRQDVARRRLTRFEDGYNAGTFDPWNGGWTYETVAVSKAIARFVAEKEETRRPSTARRYRLDLEAWNRDHVPDGHMLRALGLSHLRPFIYDREKASTTRYNRYNFLNVFFGWCIDHDLLDDNPLDHLRRPKKDRKTPAFFDPAEVERLLIYIEDWDSKTVDAAGRRSDHRWLRDLIRVGVCTGLRRNELLNLRWADVDLDGRRLVVRNRGDFTTKSGSERVVPLAGDALDTLRRMNGERTNNLDGPVFTDGRDMPILPNRVSKRFKFFCREAKVKNRERLKFHSLRHTCASWLSMKGVPLRVIQQILGHASIRQTEIYSHLQPEVMQRAMEETFAEF